MSQTTGTQLTFDEEKAEYLYYLGQFGQFFQIFGLLGGLYGKSMHLEALLY